MRTRKPIRANSTQNLLRRIFPETFKFVSDDESNGYKFVNLLFGVEVDEVRRKIREVYENSFLATMDFSPPAEIYEVYTPTPTGQYLGAEGLNIKITDQNEFYNGDATRLEYTGTIGLYDIINSNISGYHYIGLEYVRTNERGNGSYYLNLEIDQVSGYLNNEYPTYRINVDNLENVIDYSGLYAGVKIQDYTNTATDDLIQPETEEYLRLQYPLTRTVVDNSGVQHTIDHYTPFNGWFFDSSGVVQPVVNYDTDYFYDINGNKVYYRTANNNPYGFGNYTSIYKELRFAPISGSVRVYDINNLDISGNAIEILSGGTDVYYFQNSGMLDIEANNFDPIYRGYSSTVPSGVGFIKTEGQSANLLTTTSWEIQREGRYFDEGTMQWVNGIGDYTNIIKINNPISNYIVEYSLEQFKRVKYISSQDSTRYIRLGVSEPLYSIDDITNNLKEVKFEFLRNPTEKYPTSAITFNGLDIRPNSTISRIDFNVPYTWLPFTPMTEFVTLNTKKSIIGFTSETVPVIPESKINAFNCNFNGIGITSGSTEIDTISANNIRLLNTGGTNRIVRSVGERNYGKRFFYNTDDLYYYLNNVSYLIDRTTDKKTDVFFYFRFKSQIKNNITIMELNDVANTQYITVQIKENGRIEIGDSELLFSQNNVINFNNNIKELLIHFRRDVYNPLFSIPDVYLREYPSSSQKFGYSPLTMSMNERDPIIPSTTHIHFFKNSSVEIDNVKIYYKVI